MLSKYKGLKRIIAGSMCALMVVTSLVGCGSKTDVASDSSSGSSVSAVASESTAVAPKEVTISVANYPTETNAGERAKWDNWLKVMKEKYPNITVKPDEYNYDVNTFIPKAASGQLSTVYSAFLTEVDKIISGGYSADITDAMLKYGYDKAINPDLLKLTSRDGKYYAMPDGGYTMGLMYNVKLWKDAGLVDENGVPKFPKTYDELAQDAKIIKDKTGKASFFFPGKSNQGGWQFMSIAWSFGADFEKKVDGKWTATFNTPEAVAALQYLMDLKWKYNAIQDNILADGNDMFKLLGTDQVATAFGTYDWIQNPINDYKASKDNIALSALPAGPKANYTLAGGSAIFFANNATPEQIDAGFKWKEITGYSPKYTDEDSKAYESNVKALADKNNIAGIVGLRTWTDPNRVAMEDSILKKYLNVDINMFKDYMDNSSKNMKPEVEVACQELYKAIDGVVQEVLTKKDANPQAVLDKAVAAFQKDYLDKVN